MLSERIGYLFLENPIRFDQKQFRSKELKF